MITMESGSTPWTTGGVIAAMTVGLSVAAAVWWLCSRSRVRIKLKRVVEVEKEALFRFLSDPRNLKLIHPLTTEIRVEEEREEDGGLTVTRFVWVEKMLFTFETDVRMCSDPSTSTIFFDIRPFGRRLEVQLKWDCSGLAENRAGSVNLVSSDSPSDQDESPAPQRYDNFSDTSQDNGVAAAAAATTRRKAATAAATTHQKDDDGVISWKRERSSTLFQNRISVTGTRAIAAVIAAAMLGPVHLKFMNRLQQHFMTKKE